MRLVSLCVLGFLVHTSTAFLPRLHHQSSTRREPKVTMSSELLSELLRDKVGDYVTVDLQIRDTKSPGPFNPYFDTGSDVRLLVNGGGLHPIVHELANRLTTPGQTITEVRNGGPHNPGASADIPLASAPGGLAVGDVVSLSNGAKARVTKLTAEALTIDANPPLAGRELEFRLTLQSRAPKLSLESITVAAGCFWGAELAFQRVPGVVFTRVGYTQGAARSPSYEEVCSGRTGHTEAVFALFDPTLVSYAALLKVFWARHDPTQLNAQGNDEGTQYRGGIYYHSLEQRMQAEASMAEEAPLHAKPLATELLPAGEFWVAEEYHQQYLERFTYQSAVKGAGDKIRCYG